MLLPRNGRIVVIDDKQEEALPLLRSLWQNGFSAIYFTGEKRELPPIPLDDVKVIFLDMELETGGYTGSNDKTKAATTAKVLKSIINTNTNSAYFIIMWAIHTELIESFWTYVKDSKCSFIPLVLNKVECKSKGYDLKLITEKINSILEGNDAFNFFINWENVIYKSSNDIFFDISSLFPVDAGWNKKILEIFKKLAKECAGKNLDENDYEQIVKYAMLTLNGTFTDSLENNIVCLEDTGISFEGITGVPDGNVRAKINSKLHLDRNNTNAKPGCIYSHTENDDIQEYFKINHGNDPDGIEKVFCEVSPTCDYAQRKWKYHRILYGIKVPAGAAKLEQADYLYKTDTFDIDGQAIRFVFDLRKLKSRNLGELDSLPVLCTFRHDLIVDIQHKIANHSSRPGILSL